MHTLLEVSNGPNGSSHVPAFLAKLWKIVDDSTTNDLICWSEMGNSFLIRNQSKFARELLPLYYKHNNMASFVRQLNMYGFHKVVSVDQGGLRTDKDEMEFAHPFFLRGSEATLELIKRKIPAAKLEDSRGTRPDTINKVLLDVRQMKGRQDTMDNKLLNVKRENEALWRELSVLRQKHSKQQQIVSKLLQFLVGMMSSQSHRIGFKRRMPMSMPLMLSDADGLKSSKRNKSGGELVGPVIRDVTEYINTGGRLLENQLDYMVGQNSEVESHPKVDSPGSSVQDRSPYPESVYPMSPYDDPDMLLSVDPLAINPSMDIRSPPPPQAPPKRSSKQSGSKAKGGKKPGATPKKSHTVTLSEATSDNPTSQDVNPLNPQNYFVTDAVNIQGNQAGQSLPTVMYLPGTETPIHVMLSLPEPMEPSTSNVNKQVPVAPTANAMMVPSKKVTAPAKVVATTGTNAVSEALPTQSVEIRIPSPKVSAKAKKPDESETLEAGENGILSEQPHMNRNEVVAANMLKPNLYEKEVLDEHLDDVQYGLDNLRELLKQEQYTIDPSTLLTLFGSDSDILALGADDQRKDNEVNTSNSTADESMNMVAYNPSLYELADDDSQFFDYQNNGVFLDDELESMLTTDRDRLNKGDLQAGDIPSS